MLLVTLLVSVPCLARSASAENWPQWRGPRGDGTSLDKNVPKQWDVTKAVWKKAVPGIGHASPIVWGERVFTVTAIPEKRDRMLLSFDRATGKILWQQIVAHGPLQKINPQNSYASATPATDGKRVYVNFRVSPGPAMDPNDDWWDGWYTRDDPLQGGVQVDPRFDWAAARCDTAERLGGDDPAPGKYMSFFHEDSRYYTSPEGKRLFQLDLGPYALSLVGASSKEDIARCRELMRRYPDTWLDFWVEERGAIPLHNPIRLENVS